MYILYVRVACGFPVSLTRKMDVWAENAAFTTDIHSSSSTWLFTEAEVLLRGLERFCPAECLWHGYKVGKGCCRRRAEPYTFCH